MIHAGTEECYIPIEEVLEYHDCVSKVGSGRHEGSLDDISGN